jgi:hypothetical protein
MPRPIYKTPQDALPFIENNRLNDFFICYSKDQIIFQPKGWYSTRFGRLLRALIGLPWGFRRKEFIRCAEEIIAYAVAHPSFHPQAKENLRTFAKGKFKPIYGVDAKLQQFEARVTQNKLIKDQAQLKQKQDVMMPMKEFLYRQQIACMQWNHLADLDLKSIENCFGSPHPLYQQACELKKNAQQYGNNLIMAYQRYETRLTSYDYGLKKLAEVEEDQRRVQQELNQETSSLSQALDKLNNPTIYIKGLKQTFDDLNKTEEILKNHSQNAITKFGANTSTIEEFNKDSLLKDELKQLIEKDNTSLPSIDFILDDAIRKLKEKETLHLSNFIRDHNQASHNFKLLRNQISNSIHTDLGQEIQNPEASVKKIEENVKENLSKIEESSIGLFHHLSHSIDSEKNKIWSDTQKAFSVKKMNASNAF